MQNLNKFIHNGYFSSSIKEADYEIANILNKELERLNFSVEKVNYREISKFGGLFRCSTLPLERKS